MAWTGVMEQNSWHVILAAANTNRFTTKYEPKRRALLVWVGVLPLILAQTVCKSLLYPKWRPSLPIPLACLI